LNFLLAAALPRGHNLPISVSYLHACNRILNLFCVP